MKLDEYNIIISAISDEIAQIAKLMRDQAWAQCANTSNPAFRRLLSRHAQLTEMAAKLNKTMFSLV